MLHVFIICLAQVAERKSLCVCCLTEQTSLYLCCQPAVCESGLSYLGLTSRHKKLPQTHAMHLCSAHAGDPQPGLILEHDVPVRGSSIHEQETFRL